MKIYKVDKLKDLIQSSHVNFLLGSGLSCPYLTTLCNIEKHLTDAQDIEDDKLQDIVEASLLVAYFRNVMRPCSFVEIEKLDDKKKDDYEIVKKGYTDFLNIWNLILARRKCSLLDKKVNIFTTNIDNFVEICASETRIEFNDGFKGQLNPIFSIDSFNNIVSKVSPLYHNTSQIPIFNYLKIHGSINWRSEIGNGLNLTCDRHSQLLEEIEGTIKNIPDDTIVANAHDFSTISDLRKAVENLIKNINNGCKTAIAIEDALDKIKIFKKAYEKLIMIHPRKTKFRETVLHMYFYELMRHYSNSLESHNSVLFVAGFSFADEHIAQLTVRASNSNPTLQVIVFAYNDDARSNIIANLKKAGNIHNDNISVISPSDYYTAQEDSEQEMLSNSGFIVRKQIEQDSEVDPDTIQINDDDKEQNKTEASVQIEHRYEGFSLSTLNQYVFSRILKMIY